MTKWQLAGKRKKVRLNRHEITIIAAPPRKEMYNLEEGQKKLRKILSDAE